MSEQFSHHPNQLEAANEAIERIRETLEIQPYTSEDQDMDYVAYTRFKIGDTYTWNRQYGEPFGIEVTEVDPSASDEQARAFADVEAVARQDGQLLRGIAKAEGRWWLDTPSESDVETKLQEVFIVKDGAKEVALLNCAETALSDEEKESTAKVFNMVSNYTSGKLYDRVKGVIMVTSEQLGDNVMGDYQAASGVLRMNIDALRAKDELGRYKEFFVEGDTSWYEIVFAHELGHAMDITNTTELEAHDIDKDQVPGWQAFGGFTTDFSGFHALNSWNPVHTEGATKLAPKTEWVYDATNQFIECAPTDYAQTDPREDFAESFAIHVLGGDVSKIPERVKQLHITIQHATGSADIGPREVHMHAMEQPNEIIKPIDTIGLRAYIAQ